MHPRHAALFAAFIIAVAGTFALRSGVFASSFQEYDHSAAPTVSYSFTDAAVTADRPGDGMDLFDNIHVYMWRDVYVIGVVEDFLPRTEEGFQYVILSTWDSQAGYKTNSSPFHRNYETPLQLEVEFPGTDIRIMAPVIGDVLLLLSPGIELTDVQIELVGVACGIHQWQDPQFRDQYEVYALPVICILDDGVERIRPWPVVTSFLEE